MIDAERILGSLLSRGMSSSGRRRGGRGSAAGGIKGSLGLGVLGVAMAAFEHYRQKEAPPPSPPARPQSGPPPLPAAAGLTPPPPPLASPSGEGPGDSEALLLVRAMVAAASADGTIDREERESIFARLHAAGLSDEEKNFVAGELSSPPRLEDILAGVKTRELARQVYAVSLLAVTVDTGEERKYLADLRRRLDLDESEAKSIEEKLAGPGSGDPQ